MPLAAVDLERVFEPIPDGVRALIADAQTRVEAFYETRADEPVVAFVPCDFAAVYRALSAIRGQNLSAGNRFIEWGSGIGAVACLAAELGFDAVGIEIEPDLVRASCQLAEEFRLDPQFVCGSFVPDGRENLVQLESEITWLRTDGTDAYRQIDLEPDDFDLVFAYPWPGEERVIFRLFDRCASAGALLLTFHGLEGLRLHRKIGRG